MTIHDPTIYLERYDYTTVNTKRSGDTMLNMELELDGSGEIVASGNIEITLPGYMTMLSQPELDEARLAVHKECLVIAAGKKPRATEVVLFTADNRVFVFDAVKHQIPIENVHPVDCGLALAINDESDFLASDWVLELSDAIDVTLLS